MKYFMWTAFEGFCFTMSNTTTTATTAYYLFLNTTLEHEMNDTEDISNFTDDNETLILSPTSFQANNIDIEVLNTIC